MRLVGHPVAPRTSDRRRGGLQTDFLRERQRLVGNVAEIVVAEPLDFCCRPLARHRDGFPPPEAPCPWCGLPSTQPTDGFPVAAVQRKDDRQRCTIVRNRIQSRPITNTHCSGLPRPCRHAGALTRHGEAGVRAADLGSARPDKPILQERAAALVRPRFAAEGPTHADSRKHATSPARAVGGRTRGYRRCE